MAELRAIDCEPEAEGLVPYIEELLEVAKGGNLSAVACAVVYRDGSTGNSHSPLPSRATMLGSIEVLKADIVAAIQEGR